MVCGRNHACLSPVTIRPFLSRVEYTRYSEFENCRNNECNENRQRISSLEKSPAPSTKSSSKSSSIFSQLEKKLLNSACQLMQRRRAVLDLIEPLADCGPSTIGKLPRTDLVSHTAANAVTSICSCAGLAFRVELDCQLDAYETTSSGTIPSAAQTNNLSLKNKQK